MKRNIIYKMLMGAALIVGLSACYDDYTVDTIGFSDVYFAQEIMKRSALAGEGLDIKVGICLGGMRVNENGFTAIYKVDTSAMAEYPTYTLMPEEYYTLSTKGSNNSEVLIEAGEFLGYIDVAFDSLKLANDPLLVDYNYAIPFKITATSADSILSTQQLMIVPIKVMNTYEGFYYAEGTNMYQDTLGNWLEEEQYGDSLNWPITPIRDLSSVMMQDVTIDGVANRGGDEYRMKLHINADNSVEVIPVAGSLFQVSPNGTSTWDPVRRVFNLNYKFTVDGVNHKVSEKLTFRNRIRDGINQWQWEGFDGN